MALALCLALGGMVQAGWTTCPIDSSQSSERWQPARDIAAIALTTRTPQFRAAHLNRSPVAGLEYAGVQAAAARQVYALALDRRAPLPRSCAVTPRSGRSPPLSA
jgi:hypothetical protein